MTQCVEEMDEELQIRQEKTRTQTVSAKFRLLQAFLPFGPDDLAEPVKSEEAVAFRDTIQGTFWQTMVKSSLQGLLEL